MRQIFQQFLQSESSGGGRMTAGEAAGTFARVVEEELGQDLIEYALLAAMLGLGAVSTMHGLANQISNSFSSVSNNFSNAVTAPATSTGSGGTDGGDRH